MLIDWFTVAAQVVNFLILLVLLKIFLFDKIKSAMAQREENIQDRFDKAKKQEQAARKEKDRYSQKMQSLDEEWEDKLEQADREAREKRDHLIEDARQEVDDMKKDWQNSLEKEKASFLERFQEQTARVIFDTVKKTLSELADTDAQDQAVKQFLSRFEELDKEKLPDTLEEPPRVSTGFALSEKQQTAVQKTLSRKWSNMNKTAFDVRPELVFGVALAAGDKKMTWHAQEYLGTLEKELDLAIEGKKK